MCEYVTGESGDIVKEMAFGTKVRLLTLLSEIDPKLTATFLLPHVIKAVKRSLLMVLVRLYNICWGEKEPSTPTLDVEPDLAN
ncbi:hypothetical protein MM221_03950 [Salipaludibacillus sp. LMS25]|uniref:hypothetical protein n=1 Tax=Salipaludibacillus sp. LMS25 TaxID=2924031 RepID=UPI0020D12A30|nr:hypothetical protein [Salipaludibacillus sp. LMS25]UTR15750.1 hypothetical protein MM221_03950 [Salipaludibacillus sp. LMS25]